MPRVAHLTAAAMRSDAPQRRVDAYEHDLQMAALRPACAALGIDLVDAVWDDPDLDPGLFDAVVIGTPWDYMEDPERFLEQLGRIADRTRLFNPLEVVRWNLSKTYLRDLAARGAPVVPTLWCEAADDVTISEAFDALDCDRLVVKPEVGAGAWRQVRVERDAPLPPEEERPAGRAMIQPYLPEITTFGEASFVFCGDTCSHVLRKVPCEGDYRVQSMYGAREEVHPASDAEVALARRVVDAVGEDLLYARVDMVRGLDGELAVMELELVEPYLYPEQGPELGTLLARALAERLG